MTVNTVGKYSDSQLPTFFFLGIDHTASETQSQDGTGQLGVRALVLGLEMNAEGLGHTSHRAGGRRAGGFQTSKSSYFCPWS